MKKLLLLSAVALLAGTANAQAPTITKVFEYTSGIPATRYGTGFNGRVYTTENNVVYYWDENNEKVQYASCSPYGNAAMAFDQAGNLLINQGLWGTGPTNWCIISAEDQSMTEFTIDVPDGLTKSYVHQTGRVIGNVLSDEGGYLTLAYNNATQAIVVKIVNGAVDKTYVSTEIDTEVSNAFSNAGITVPALNSVEEFDAVDNPANHIYWRKRTVGNIFYFNASGETKYYPYGDSQRNGEGFDVFTLDNTLLALYPYGTGGSYGSGFLIANLKTGETIITQDSPMNTTSGAYYNSLYAEIVDDNTAFIHHYNNATCAAVYKLEIPTDYLTGVETVGVDANAPVEYYNLQGVKVANPESGLYIKRQGGKATKVIL